MTENMPARYAHKIHEILPKQKNRLYQHRLIGTKIKSIVVPPEFIGKADLKRPPTRPDRITRSTVTGYDFTRATPKRVIHTTAVLPCTETATL